MSNRKIICPSCNTIFLESLLKQRQSEETCLVCGASLNVDETEIDNESESAQEEELVTWYYYDLGDGAYYLNDQYMEDDEDSKLIYTFKAPPRDEENGAEAAKEVLRREYKHDAFLESEECTINKPDALWASEGKCPRCHSSNLQLVPRKFSIWTGFRTNKVDRMCVNCGYRF